MPTLWPWSSRAFATSGTRWRMKALTDTAADDPRGDPRTTGSDTGSMELFASNVVSSDPLEVVRTLKEYLQPEKEA